MQRLLVCLFCIAALGSAPSAAAGKVVREFSGGRSTYTGDFEVRAPWLIDWQVSGEFHQSLSVSIILINAEDGSHAGRIVETRQPGDGLRLMNESGRFRFRVDSSMAHWTIRVEQLNEGEEKLYTPKRPDGA